MADEKRTVTVPEAAELLGVSAWNLYERIKADDFPHFRVGRRILIPKDAVEAHCKSSAVPPIDSEALSVIRKCLVDAQEALARLAEVIDGRFA